MPGVCKKFTGAAIGAIFLLAGGSAFAVHAENDGATTKTKNQTLLLHGGISALAGACAGAGITLEASTLPTIITRVRMGTPAAYGGLCDGDKLLQGTLGTDTMHLLIERGGKRYSLNLRYTPDNLTRKTSQINALHLSAEATRGSDWKTLKQYDIAMMIDASGSMQAVLENYGMSKWQWCLDQIYSFGKEAQTLGNGPFQFCTFDLSHTLKQSCTAEEARAIMSGLNPNGGTDLSTPLAEIINNRLAAKHERPLLIVIVTDGLPNGGVPVEQVITEASRRVKSESEIKILFLQIGNDAAGKLLADYLDNDLTLEGAPHDLVTSIRSDDLLQLGLRRGLVAGLNSSNGDGANPGSADPAVLNELNRVRAELARLRAKNNTAR